MNIWQSFVRSWKQRMGLQISTLAVLSLTFILILGLFTLAINFSHILSIWGESIQMTVYLKDEIDEVKRLNIEKSLNNLSDVHHITYVSKDDTHKIFKHQMEKYIPEFFISSKNENPFPATFQIALKEILKKTDSLEIVLNRMAVNIKQIDGVEDVSYGQDWIEKYAVFIRVITSLMWFTVSILLIGSIFVFGYSIHTSISEKREEIEIMELVGATKSMIRSPLILEGTLMGTLAAIISLIVNYGFYIWQKQLLSSSFSFVGLVFHYQYLGILGGFCVILLGAIIGSFGSYICVCHINDGWSASQNLL